MRPTSYRRGLAIGLIVCGAGCSDADAPSTTPAADATPVGAAFVGNTTCAACHAEQSAAWTDSHHALAMRAATDETVLGDFDGATFSRNGVTSTFTRRGEDFIVDTDGPDGALAQYRVAYTFGVEPLQQYLLELESGRMQALDIAWDTRPSDQGGQRWFDLQPGEALTADDPLHWTGLLLRWNSNCAECHSTDVDKNYDPEQQRYATTFADVNVGCEACHGPGSLHAAAPTEVGLALSSVARAWVFTDGASIAARVPSAHSSIEIEACAQCHARRSQLTDDFEPGEPFLDGFRPAYLTDPLYHADGQILDEVYVYGSFLQSRMHAAGVTCTDCHDPHSSRLRADGNGVCGQCHSPSAFDTPAHHRHATGTAAADCVSCHMRAETYMIVDPRRDHSFRVPRPDLSRALGTPNACNDCHDESAAWAAERVAEWFPDGRNGTFHYAEALDAGRNWTAERGRLLRNAVSDGTLPAIVRGTALGLLAEQLDDASLEIVGAALDDPDPLVQLAALDALALAPQAVRIRLGQRFLTHRLLTLRLAAVEALLPVRDALSARRQSDLERALDELRATQDFNADRPEALLSRASLELELGRADTAETVLRSAIDREPGYAASYANLADLHRQLGREDEAAQALRDGLAVAPDSAALTHALGLALVRTGRPDDALELLARAVALAPDDPRYAYVYGVALNSLATSAAALESLTRTHERFPGHAPTLVALATMHRDAGDRGRALDYAHRLLALTPADAVAQALIDELE